MDRTDRVTGKCQFHGAPAGHLFHFAGKRIDQHQPKGRIFLEVLLFLPV